MNQSKMSELQPPFFPKTLTKFRNESFYAIKPVVQHALIQSDQEKFMNGLSILKNFIVSIDC